MHKVGILFLMLIAATPLHGNLNAKYMITNERLITLIQDCYSNAQVYQKLGSGQLNIFSEKHQHLDIKKVAKKIFKKQCARYIKTADPSCMCVDCFIKFLVHDDTEPQYLSLLQRYEIELLKNHNSSMISIIHRDFNTKENISNLVKTLEQSLRTYMLRPDNTFLHDDQKQPLQQECNIFIQTTDTTIVIQVNFNWLTCYAKQELHTEQESDFSSEI